MKFLLNAFFLILSSEAFSKDLTFSCDFHWKTLAENISIKDRSVIKRHEQIINNDISVILKIDKKLSMLTVTEFYKDNRKNFVQHNFSCDQSLSCNGKRLNVVDGKRENEKITIPKTSQYGSGKIGSRELFKYENLKDGFSYNYIIYRNEANQAMGLHVNCRKKAN